MFNQTAKFDAGKIRPTIIPTEAIVALAKTMEYGAKKYYQDSWKTNEPIRYADALYRHLLAYIDNPKSVDDESGLPHIWHILTNAAFLTYFNEQEETDVCQN